MKYITLSAATILSLGLISQASARESFYNLGNVEPSISVNLGALGNLEAQTPVYNGKPVSGYVNIPGSTVAAKPVVQKLHAKAVPTPKAKPVMEETAKVDEQPTPTIPVVETTKTVIEPAKPVVETPKAIVENKSAPVITITEEENKPAPEIAAKPAITLPTVVASDVKANPAPDPSVVAENEARAKAMEAARTRAQALANEMPPPAIIPETVKAKPPIPTKEAMVLSKNDKIVSLPATTKVSTTTVTSTTSALPDLSTTPVAATPLPKMADAKPIITVKDPAPPAADNNIATPSFVVDGGDVEAHAQAKLPTPAPKAQVRKIEPTPAPRLVASVSDKVEIPAKSVTSTTTTTTETTMVKMDDSLTTPPKEVKPATIIAPTTAPKIATNTERPALPPIASVGENPLEKPTAKGLPPLSSLYDKNETSAQATSAELAPPTAAAPTAKASMPMKETVMVQPQPAPLSEPATSGATLSMVYGEAEVELPLTEKPKLDGIISQLASNKDMRVAVLAYASGTPDQASQAKRTALARALAVRSYLLEHNIAPDRMDIKPLGNKAGSGVPDRVDIVLQKSSNS